MHLSIQFGVKKPFRMPTLSGCLSTIPHFQEMYFIKYLRMDLFKNRFHHSAHLRFSNTS